jgi:hypothetical protein
MLPAEGPLSPPKDALPPDYSLVLVPHSTGPPPLTPDQWVPERAVCEELDLTSMTTWRYDRSRKMVDLGWPLPLRVNGRIYRSRAALDAFKRNLADAALREREALLCAVNKQTAEPREALDAYIAASGREVPTQTPHVITSQSAHRSQRRQETGS